MACAPRNYMYNKTFEDLSCLSWFALGLFGSLLFVLYSSGQVATSQVLSQ